MNNTAKYIYGVTNTGSLGAVSGLPVPNGAYTVSYKDVSAVVSDSEIFDYKNLPADVAAQHLVRHQLVIEKIMEDSSIIPMRLGTYVLNEDEVTQALANGYGMFKEVFGEVEGRMEIDVAASWADLNAVIREVSEEGEVRALKQLLLDRKEQITVDDQVKMGALIKSHLTGKKNAYACAIRDSLGGLSRKMKEHVMNDDMRILNAAFFIDNSVRNPFEERLDELNNGFGGKVHFKCIGPLPPYSFYVLEITKFGYEEIDRARRKLGLDEFATKDDVKRAYRKCASLCHPDRRFNMQSVIEKAQAETEFDEITNAYRLLSVFCRREGCAMNEKEVMRNSISVRIKEQ